MNDLPAGLRLYRNQLRDAVAHDLGRRTRPLWRRPRFALGIAAPTLALGAAAAAVVVVFSGGPRASSADAAILHRVAAALSPHSGTILHEQASVTIAGQAPTRYELWEQADSPYAYRVIKFGHEGSWNGTSYADYDASSNRIVVQPGGSSGRTPDDAAAELRSLVESGQATVDAETTLDGVAAYKLTVSGASSHYLDGTVYVARDDYRPLQIQTTTQAGPDGAEVGETIQYQTYEYLPADQANLALVDLAAQHPGAQVVTQQPGGKPTSTTSK
jgi:hypothetical protein